VLGWPLRPLYTRDPDALSPAQLRTLGKLEDYEISVGGLITGWNPLCHDDYWEAGSLVTPVAEHLASLCRAIDS